MEFPRQAVLLACAASSFVLGACGGDGGGTTDPGPRGDFSVLTTSTGPELDSDGYEIQVNGVFAAIIGVNDSVEFANRAVDSYSVALTEVAENCTVAGANPRPVQLIDGGKVATTFEVACVTTAGGLQVVTSTSGPNPDDGYTLAVDDLDAGTIGANDTILAAELVTGEHTVRLGDIALNCRLVGDAARNVMVPSKDVIETTYEVICTDVVGSLRVVTTTSGVSPDPDGYEVVIEFGSPIAIGATDAKIVGSVAAGVTRIQLLESTVADNCAVDGDNPRSVTVPAGGLVETVFEVTCEAP